MTLNFENERGCFESTCIVATPEDIAGNTAEFTTAGPGSARSRAGFNDEQLAILPVEGFCEDGPSEPATIPVA